MFFYTRVKCFFFPFFVKKKLLNERKRRWFNFLNKSITLFKKIKFKILDFKLKSMLN